MNKIFKIVFAVFTFLILNSLFLIPDVFAVNMSSENFKVEGGDFKGGGTTDSASSNFSLNASFGENIIGDSVSSNFQTGAGFQNLIPVPAPTPAPTPSPTPSVGGGGGIASGGGIPSHINAFNVPLSIAPSQSGTLLQDFFDNHSARLEVPSANIVSQTTFTITKRIVAPDAVREIVAVDVTLISDDVFRITALDENGNLVTSFPQSISITITIPDMPTDLSDIGLYFLDIDALLWRLIPDAVFSADSVTFSVDHLTDFVIFTVPGLPLTLPASPGVSIVTAPTPFQPPEVVTPVAGVEAALPLFDILVGPTIGVEGERALFVFVGMVLLAVVVGFVIYRKTKRMIIKKRIERLKK